jgi:acyl CoA:acetate/3-ketoacid CoA transferase beta subunit
MGVIDITPQGLLLREIAPGFSPEDVQKETAPTLLIAPDLKPMLG